MDVIVLNYIVNRFKIAERLLELYKNDFVTTDLKTLKKGL